MTIQNLYPNIDPTLLLDFANVKALDPRITFTRTTTATYYGTETAKAEENLLTYSQEFDNAYWLKTNSTVTANTEVAPDGTTTADTFTANGAAGTHFLNPGVVGAMVAGATRTLSVFAKAGTNNFIQLAFGGDATPYANFDLSGGTVENNASVTASIVSVGSGWYRCIVTTTSATADSSRFFMITDGTSVRGESNSLSTTVILWGAQMEFRSAVTAYTPTTTQPITNYIPVLETAAAGVARFDHNPTTGESLGLLVEEQRTNLIVRSEEFDNAAWTNTRSSEQTNVIISPAGTLTGDKIIANTDNDSHIIAQSVSGTTNTNPYTFSVYIKAGEYSSVLMRMVEGSPFTRATQVVFNVSSGAFSALGDAGGASASSASITAVGNGWYRCSLTTTLGGSAGSIVNQVFLLSGDLTIFAGNDFDGLFLWGAQLEAGAFPTSYIATTTASVTRNADAASMTGTNFSSWYSVDNVGSVYVEANETFVGNNSGPWWLNNGTASRGIAYRRETTTNNLGFTFRQPDGTFRTTTVSGAIPAGQYNKVVASFNASASSVSVNGASATTSTSNNLYPSVDQLRIGLSQIIGSSPFIWCGTIKKLSYYPQKLTDAQLQALTS